MNMKLNKSKVVLPLFLPQIRVIKVNDIKERATHFVSILKFVLVRYKTKYKATGITLMKLL